MRTGLSIQQADASSTIGVVDLVFFFVFTFYGSLNAVKFQCRQNATSDIVMVYPQEMLSDVLIPHVWPVALSKVLSYVLQTI